MNLIIINQHQGSLFVELNNRIDQALEFHLSFLLNALKFFVESKANQGVPANKYLFLLVHDLDALDGKPNIQLLLEDQVGVFRQGGEIDVIFERRKLRGGKGSLRGGLEDLRYDETLRKNEVGLLFPLLEGRNGGLLGQGKSFFDFLFRKKTVFLGVLVQNRLEEVG